MEFRVSATIFESSLDYYGKRGSGWLLSTMEVCDDYVRLQAANREDTLLKSKISNIYLRRRLSYQLIISSVEGACHRAIYLATAKPDQFLQVFKQYQYPEVERIPWFSRVRHPLPPVVIDGDR